MRVHEAEGQESDHIFTIEDEVHQFEIAVHSRQRRVKPKPSATTPGTPASAPVDRKSVV